MLSISDERMYSNIFRGYPTVSHRFCANCTGERGGKCGRGDFNRSSKPLRTATVMGHRACVVCVCVMIHGMRALSVRPAGPMCPAARPGLHACARFSAAGGRGLLLVGLIGSLREIRRIRTRPINAAAAMPAAAIYRAIPADVTQRRKLLLLLLLLLLLPMLVIHMMTVIVLITV